VAIRHATSDHHRPATPDIVTRSACTIDLPAAWQGAIEAGTLRVPNTGQFLQAGDSAGEILVLRHAGAKEQLVLILPDGTTKPVLEMPANGRYRMKSATVDARWIVVSIADHSVPVSAVPPVVEFDLIDRSTLQLSHRITVAKDMVVYWPALLFGDHIYWMQIPSGSPSGPMTLQDYNIAAGTTRTLTSGSLSPIIYPGGLAWTDDARHLTQVFAGSRPPRIPGLTGSALDLFNQERLISDGRAYAWVDGSGIAWWSGTGNQTVKVHGLAAPGVQIQLRAVAGPYVLAVVGNNAQDDRLIDTRTGAIAPFNLAGTVASPGGVFAYATTDHTVVLHPDRLPGLHC
jgi:hypothetical protein